MKVILLQDIVHIGKKHDIKDVADGHAMNLLIPKKLVREASPSAVKEVEKLKARADVERKVQEDLLAKNLKDLEGKHITISAKANDKGHLFAGIHKNEIAEAVQKELRLTVTPDFIELPEALKATGEYDVAVSVQGKKATIKITIKAL